MAEKEQLFGMISVLESSNKEMIEELTRQDSLSNKGKKNMAAKIFDLNDRNNNLTIVNHQLQNKIEKLKHDNQTAYKYNESNFENKIKLLKTEVRKLKDKNQDIQVKFKESTNQFTNQINELKTKLESTLSSDIESREYLDNINKSLYKTVTVISEILSFKIENSIIDDCDNPSEIKKTELSICLDKSRKALAEQLSAPELLVPLYEIVFRLCEEHILLLQNEMREEKLVANSVNLTKSARKIIKTLTIELSSASDIIYQSDTFLVDIITLLERNNISLSPNLSSGLFEIESRVDNNDFEYAKALPKRYDSEVITMFITKY